MQSERIRHQLIEALRKTLAGNRPIVPEAGRLFWSIFVDLSGSRSYSMTGPNPISYAEIDAWARLNRWPLQPHHIALIRAMDDAWLQNAGAKGASKSGSAPPQPINPEVFDAVF